MSNKFIYSSKSQKIAIDLFNSMTYEAMQAHKEATTTEEYEMVRTMLKSLVAFAEERFKDYPDTFESFVVHSHYLLASFDNSDKALWSVLTESARFVDDSTCNVIFQSLSKRFDLDEESKELLLSRAKRAVTVKEAC